jgi:hypothetical protein
MVDKSGVDRHCRPPCSDDLASSGAKVERQGAMPPAFGHRNSACDKLAKLRETGLVNRVEWRIGAIKSRGTSMIHVEVDQQTVAEIDAMFIRAYESGSLWV